jgi:hypothetical protein
MNDMKKELTLTKLLRRVILLAAVCVTLAANGADYFYAHDVLFDGLVASNSTVTVNGRPIQLQGSQALSPSTILFETTVKGAGTGTSNVVFQLQTTIDGATWVDQYSITNALNDTNSVTARVLPASTNWVNVRAFRLATVTTTQTNDVTATLKYGYWFSR